nr:hypothetical protein OG409_35090 [Streptomyces sp. NBC_00974]
MRAAPRRGGHGDDTTGAAGTTGTAMGRRWLVTGCTSGLGHALATAAARAGDELAVTASKTADLEDLAAAWPGRITPIPRRDRPRRLTAAG